MDIQKITYDEINGYEADRLREYEGELRTKLAEMRMDVYQAAADSNRSKKALKKNLARVLTVKNAKIKAAENKVGA